MLPASFTSSTTSTTASPTSGTSGCETRHTRRTDPSLNGPSTQRSLRLPTALLSLVEKDIAKGVSEIHTMTDAVTDALWLWHYEQNLTLVAAERAAYPMQEIQHRPTFADVDMDALDKPPLDEDG